MQATSLDGITIDPDAVECLAAATSSTKGFTHNQAGPYALLFLVGFAVGIIMAIAASFVWSSFAHRNGDKRPTGSLGGNVNKFQSFDSEVARG